MEKNQAIARPMGGMAIKVYAMQAGSVGNLLPGQPVTTVDNSAHSLSLHLALHGMPSVHERPPEDQIPRNGLAPKRAYVDVLRAIEAHHLTCIGDFSQDSLIRHPLIKGYALIL
jgi:hypothetical protein